MDLNARVDVNCGRKDGWTDRQKTRHLYHTLLKQVRQKLCTNGEVMARAGQIRKDAHTQAHTSSLKGKKVDGKTDGRTDRKPDTYITPC